MAELTTKGRKAVADKNFVYPPTKKNPTGRYPIHDKAHAIAALSRIVQFGTPTERTKVKVAVCRKYSDLSSCKKKGK